eukprot:GFUD01070550.1.p1 GENE.GFUD01070550.1~~GFUD01070550.1.p1  ORF type:complete len:322 (-),score=63.17 GFUD01070550.1:477-1442(-)
MSTSISYKVTNIGEDQDVEVRRFLVSQEVEVYGSFKHLQVKLLSIFPKLKMGNFSIFWTDNEGDEVTIASDDDLYIALAEMNGPVNKLTVRTKREETSEEDSTAGEEEVTQSREDYQQWSGVFADNTRSGASSDTFGQSTTSQGPANQIIPSLILTIMQFFGVNPNGYYGFFQPTENSASSSQCPFATPTYHSRNCFCRQPNIIKFIASQFVKISAMFTKASITMSSLMMMLFILMILPSFLINSALYLAFAASLGLPLGTLITGHLLYALISCSPTFLVASGSIWAFHRVIVQRKPLLDFDLELWRRKFEVFRTRIQEQQ